MHLVVPDHNGDQLTSLFHVLTRYGYKVGITYQTWCSCCTISCSATWWFCHVTLFGVVFPLVPQWFCHARLCLCCSGSNLFRSRSRWITFHNILVRTPYSDRPWTHDDWRECSIIRNCVIFYLEKECPNSCKACSHKLGLDTSSKWLIYTLYSPPNADSAGPPIKLCAQGPSPSKSCNPAHEQKALSIAGHTKTARRTEAEENYAMGHGHACNNVELNGRDRCIVQYWSETPALTCLTGDGRCSSSLSPVNPQHTST